MFKAYTQTVISPRILVGLLLNLFVTTGVQAAILNVDPDLGVDTVTITIPIPPFQTVTFTNDCLATPCLTIAHAVSEATTGDTIILASKTFLEHDIVINKDLVFDIADTGWAVIDAGFQGRHLVVGQFSQVEMNTIKFVNGIAAEGGSIVNNGNLVITNCQFNNNIASSGAGGAVVNHGILGNHNCQHLNNQASTTGGAIFNTGTASISNTEFVSNEAGISGGGIFNGSLLFVSDSTLALNTASSGGAIDNNEGANLWILTSVLNENSASGAIPPGNGGAIKSTMHSFAVIDDSWLFNNVASASGGAIHNDDSDLTIQKSVFYDNSANDDGGAVLNVRGNATIDRSTFATNTATLGGGGAFAFGNSGNNDISNSTFFDNVAVNGGALSMFIATASVNNSTFDSNTATNGGAIHNVEAIASIINSTFSGNGAGNNGGAIFDKLLTGLTGFLDIANSTFYGNGAASGGTIFSDVVFTGSRPLRMRNSIITLSSGGGDCVNLGDPLAGGNNLVDDLVGGCSAIRIGAITANSIDSLQWNGGDTQTHALLSVSNAIDAGQANCPDPVTGLPLASDQRGEARPPVAGGAVCDIGAYELN